MSDIKTGRKCEREQLPLALARRVDRVASRYERRISGDGLRRHSDTAHQNCIETVQC